MKRYLPAIAALVIVVSISSAQTPSPSTDTNMHCPVVQNCPMNSERDLEGRHESWGDRRNDDDRRHGGSGKDRDWKCGKNKNRFGCVFGMFLLLMAAVHGLLAYIVGHDVATARLSKLWIIVALLAGLPGTAVYALFRIGNKVEDRNLKDG